MATLTLTKVFVNNVATGTAVSGWSARGRSEAYEAPGETRTYAGGRRRAIVGAGEAGSYSFQLRRISRTDVETLRGWVGQTVQVRDTKGRRFFGVYFAVDVIEYMDSKWDVAIKLSVVTWPEGV